MLPFQNITNNFINVENKFYFENSYLMIQTGHTLNNLKEYEEKNINPSVNQTMNINNIIQIGIDHEAYGHLSIVSDRVRYELAKEFI